MPYERIRVEMKVALINPLSSINNSFEEDLFPPLGLTYLGSILEEAGFSVTIIDMPISRMNLDVVRMELETGDFDIIGITSMIHTHPVGLKVAEIAKQASPKSIVTIGGIPATFNDISILKGCGAVDVVIRGEGEYTILELAKSIQGNGDFKKIRGITYRKEGCLERTQDRPFIKDLDLLLFPARHLLQMNKYLEYGAPMTISSSRGCPYQCAFCSVPVMWGCKWRARSPKNIIEEINEIRSSYACNYITFVDDTFTMDMNRTVILCDEIIKEHLNILWGCTSRANRLTERLLEKMKEAGCIKIALGVETGSQEVLERVKRDLSINYIKQVVGWIKSLGIKLKLNFMYYLPGETEEDLQKTFDLLQELDPDEMSFNKLTIFPGVPEMLPPALSIKELEERVAEFFSKSCVPLTSSATGYALLRNHLSISSKNKASTSAGK